MKNKNSLFFKCIAFTISVLSFYPSGLKAMCLNELSSIGRDSSIIVGKLDNGLTYYIKNNDVDGDKVSYSLILKAGSLEEDESQRGLAHFNEHLSFDGTPTYKDGILDGRFLFENPPKDFFINALTSQTETVYWVTVPSVRESLIDSTLYLLKDWLFADFASEEMIEKQRAIIAKEWLDFQNLDERMRRQWRPVFYSGSKWDTHQSIGLLDVIKGASKEEIMRYRAEWYRPDLAAITIVGKVNPVLVEEKIKLLFEGKASNKIERKKESVSIADNAKRNFVVASDLEQQYSYLAFYNRRPFADVKGEEKIKTLAKYSLMNLIMTDRLFEAQEANVGVVSYLGAMSFEMMKPDWVYSPNAMITRGKVNEALAILAREQERVVQHGFLASEFDKAKNIVLKQHEYKLGATTRSNQDWSKAIEKDFLTGFPAMAPNEEAALFINAIQSTTVEDMNVFHGKLWDEQNSTVVIAVPEADKASVATAEEMRRILADVKNEKLEAYRGVDASKPVFPGKEFTKGGKVKQTKALCELPVYKYTLSNGAEIVCYLDSTKKGTIQFEAISKGGKSVLDSQQSLFADMACALYNNGPVGAYSPIQFRRYLNGAQMAMNIAIDDVHENIKGSVEVSKFELFLQRINLLFNDFNFSDASYQQQLVQQKDKLKAQQAYTSDVYSHFIKEKRFYKTTAPALTDETIDAVDLKTLETIISNRFNTPSDFTFYFTGALSEVEFEKLVSKYLGGGKKTKREQWVADKSEHLKGTHAFVLEAGQDPKAEVTYIIGAPFEMNMNTTTMLQAMSPVITQKLFQTIREELRLVYDIRTNLKFQAVPYSRADFEITFKCEPQDAERICAEINKVFAAVVSQGPADQELEGIKAMMLNSKKMYESNDSFRLGCIRSHDQYYGNNYTMHLANLEFIEKMTKADLTSMLSQILNHKDGLKASFIMKKKY